MANETTKWTKGPWMVNENSHPVTISAALPEDRASGWEKGTAWPMAEVTPMLAGERGREEQIARARVMAAAPDLYEALAELVEAAPLVPNNPEMVAARAALAKARGEG